MSEKCTCKNTANCLMPVSDRCRYCKVQELRSIASDLLNLDDTLFERVFELLELEQPGSKKRLINLLSNKSSSELVAEKNRDLDEDFNYQGGYAYLDKNRQLEIGLKILNDAITKKVKAAPTATTTEEEAKEQARVTALGHICANCTDEDRIHYENMGNRFDNGWDAAKEFFVRKGTKR